MNEDGSYEATPCARDRCKFFGAPWTEGLCSRCHRERNTVFLSLLSEPVDGDAKSAEKPSLSWSQRIGSVRVSMHLLDCSSVVAGFDTEDTFSLRMTAQGRLYGLDAMRLFARCSPSRSTLQHHPNAHGITLVFIKQLPRWWDRLCADVEASRELMVSGDMSRWVEDDEDEYFEDPDLERALLREQEAEEEEVDEEDQDEEDEHVDFRFHNHWVVTQMEEMRPKQLSGGVFDACDGLSGGRVNATPSTLRVRTEFNKAYRMMCVRDSWLGHTRMLRYLTEMDAALQAEPTLREQLADAEFFDNLAVAVVQKAFQLSSAEEARSKRCPISQDDASFVELPPSTQKPYNVLGQLYDDVTEDGKLRLAYAVQLLLKYETADTLMVKLTELGDRVPRCRSARKHGFNMIFTHAARCKEQAERKEAASDLGDVAQRRIHSNVSTGGGVVGVGLSPAPADASFGANRSDDAHVAIEHVRRCFEEFLDDHKERAFHAAFLEPSTLYFHSLGDRLSLACILQHGINWYLVLLQEGLGVTTPFLPDYNDAFCMGCADFWRGLSPEVWNAFSDPSTFGSGFGALPLFRKVKIGSAEFVRDGTLACEFPRGVQTEHPRDLASILHDQRSTQTALVRRLLALYLERFAFFFSREFFLSKALETLNAESKPEHAGFRRALATAFDAFRREMNAGVASHLAAADSSGVAEGATICEGTATGAGAERACFAAVAEENVDEYCYHDEYFTSIDLEKVDRLFAWLGFVKPPSAPEICPICFEEKHDVEILEHWWSSGDISSHKMCSDCRSKYPRNECPFCKEVLLKEEFLGFIKQFTRSVQRDAVAQESVSSMGEVIAVANSSAQLMERWQLFEMEHDGNARLVHRVAAMVIEGLALELGRAATQSTGGMHWLCSIAGVVFRLHTFIVEKEVDVAEAHASALHAAVANIYETFEQQSPPDLGCGTLDGHFYGHLYNQVLAAWICAYRGQSSDAAMRTSMRRVGTGIVRCIKLWEGSGRKLGIRGRVAEVMHREYIQVTHEPCWGGKAEDIVWQTFYADDDGGTLDEDAGGGGEGEEAPTAEN